MELNGQKMTAQSSIPTCRPTRDISADGMQPVSVQTRQTDALPTISSAPSTPMRTQSPTPQEIVQQYGRAANFVATYNIPMEYKCCQAGNIRRCFCGRAPKIADLLKAYTDDEVNSWLLIHLMSIYEFSNLPEKPSEGQLAELCMQIKTSYSFLNAAEFLLFCCRFKGGKHGRFFGVVDPMAIMTGLNDFLEYRREHLEMYAREERAIQMEQLRQQWADKAEPMPDNLQFVRGLFAANGITVIPIEADDRGDESNEEIKQPASS